MHLISTALALALLSTSTIAQNRIVVRDTIYPLPPISFCQDGATHATTCTDLRLRPGTVGNLQPFEGVAVELTGDQGAITCSFVTLTSLTVLPASQQTTPSNSGGTMTVQFAGAAQPGDVYLLFLGLNLTAPFLQPGVSGTVHLDPASTVFVGVFSPMGLSTPFHTIALPSNPALQGIDFYDQSLALSNGAVETTNVDCFRF